MRRLTKAQWKQNERLIDALEEGNPDPEGFFQNFTPEPRLMTDFGAFPTPLEATRQVVEHAAPQPRERMLDFGAGLGVFAYTLLQAGVEPGNVEAVEHTQTLHDIGSRLVPQITWVWANAFEQAFWRPRMGQFDLVIGNPPWGRTLAREPWGPDDDSLAGLFLAGNGDGRKSAVAEAMALEVALRLLRPGGRAAFLLPATALAGRAWGRYNREIAIYETGRQTFPFEVDFAHTGACAILAVVRRNERPFPGQVFDEDDEILQFVRETHSG